MKKGSADAATTVSARAALMWDVCGVVAFWAAESGLSVDLLPQLRARQQPDFPVLRDCYLSTPEVRRMVLELVAECERVRKYGLQGDVVLARVALLEGNVALLRKVLRDIPEEVSGCLPCWARRQYFWELVLGSALAGAEFLPPIPELDELRALIFLRYALWSSVSVGVPAELLPPAARTAQLLRCGLTAVSEVLPAMAYMMRGEWAAAHREFQRLFPVSRELHYYVESALSAPLLVYAVLNAIHVGGDRRESACWATAAEIVLLNYAPASARNELSDFFTNLHAMIAVVSRYEPRALQMIQPGGPLARVPLIICYRYLSDKWQASLQAQQVAETLQYLEQAKLPLLAYYVRSAAQAVGLNTDFAGLPLQENKLHAEYREGCLRLFCGAQQGEGGACGIAVPPEWQRVCPGVERGSVEVFGLEDILPLLQRLHFAGIELLWRGEPLQVSDGGSAPLRMSCSAQSNGWFEIGVDMQGDVSLSLPELMTAVDVSTGNYIPVGRNRYLSVPEGQLRDLRLLRHMVCVENGRVYLPVAALPAMQPGWQLGLPPRIAGCLRRLMHPPPVPPGLTVALRSYQQEGYHWLAVRAAAGLGACLADDMGLGKTIQLLALMLLRVHRGISLVVVPLSLISNWVEESARFTPGLRVERYRSGKSLPPATRCDVVLATYGEVVANPSVFVARRWNVLALDEAQEIRNSQSRRARTLCSLTATARVCLTGTPVENRIDDLLSIMLFLNPELPLRAGRNGNSVDWLADVRRLTAPLILRRTRKGVLSELPPLTEKVYRVELSSTERAIYEHYRAAVLSADSRSRVHVLAALTRMRRLCCAPSLVQPDCRQPSTKLTAMSELAERLCGQGHRVLIFSQFTDVLDLAAPMLKNRGLRFLRMDGNTPPAEREKLVEQFQSGQASVFLLSLKVGGIGLNLTAADYVLLLDPWWNPAVEGQAAARSHRSGQQRPVTLCRFIAADTLEERMLELQHTKKELAETLVQEGTLPIETLVALL